MGCGGSKDKGPEPTQSNKQENPIGQPTPTPTAPKPAAEAKVSSPDAKVASPAPAPAPAAAPVPAPVPASPEAPDEDSEVKTTELESADLHPNVTPRSPQREASMSPGRSPARGGAGDVQPVQFELPDVDAALEAEIESGSELGQAITEACEAGKMITKKQKDQCVQSACGRDAASSALEGFNFAIEGSFQVFGLSTQHHIICYCRSHGGMAEGSVTKGRTTHLLVGDCDQGFDGLVPTLPQSGDVNNANKWEKPIVHWGFVNALAVAFEDKEDVDAAEFACVVGDE